MLDREPVVGGAWDVLAAVMISFGGETGRAFGRVEN